MLCPWRGPRFAVAAISYAVAPAILAALTQPGGERMALIVGIGGYHDLAAAITYLTTGYYRPAPGAALALWYPDPIADGCSSSPAPRGSPDPLRPRLLTEIARAKLADPAADVRGLAPVWASGGRAMLALARQRRPRPRARAARGPARAGPPRHRGARSDASPLRDLRANLLLIHGRDDPLIPASESRALAAAVPPGGRTFSSSATSAMSRSTPAASRHAAAVAGRVPPACLAGRPDRARPRALRACYDQRIRMTPAIRQATPAPGAGRSDAPARPAGRNGRSAASRRAARR